jgi:sugar lactone lactonase YvrE
LKNTFGPIGIFVDRRDRVWISSLNDRVQGFSTEGKFLFKLDGTGEPLDEFLHPHGMASDSAGNFYVADAGNQRIVKFAMPK